MTSRLMRSECERERLREEAAQREACKMRLAEPEMIPDAAHVVGKILQGAIAVEATRLTVSLLGGQEGSINIASALRNGHSRQAGPRSKKKSDIECPTEANCWGARS
jgi:hypothetical protein